MVNFFSKSRGHALAQPKIFFYGGESSKREREKMNPAIAHVTKKRGKILLHQIMVKFAHKCLSYTLARGEMNVIFFPIPKLQYN